MKTAILILFVLTALGAEAFQFRSGPARHSSTFKPSPPEAAYFSTGDYRGLAAPKTLGPLTSNAPVKVLRK